MIRTQLNNLHELPAGAFSVWLRHFRHALATGKGMSVPCGDCRACCTSGYFIHIAPGETQTLAKIPKKLLAQAPDLPMGHKVLGRFSDGRCPIFVNGECSIYAHRPQTCRLYDCRVFAAAGIEAGGREKAAINRRVRRWKFDYPTRRDREQQVAIQTAARVLGEQTAKFPPKLGIEESAWLAIMAIKVYPAVNKINRRSCLSCRASADKKLATAIMREVKRFNERMRAPVLPR
jgi:uncharacterized protein